MDPTIPDTDVDAAEYPAQHALTHLPSHLLFWSVAASFLTMDLWSKHWAFSVLGPREERTVIPGWLMFRRSLNDGAVFGSFTGYVGLFIAASLLALAFVFYLFAHSPRRRHGLHFALGLILAGALGNLYDRSRMTADVVRMTRGGVTETAMIGVVVSHPEDAVVRIGDWPEGSSVRTFERSEVEVRRQGVVRDFIKFVPRFPSWMPGFSEHDLWPWVFNIADSALVCGVTILVFASWTERKPVASDA